ncbi:MAG: Ig domain protein group 2 domain protein [Herbinix sp.]|jgi:hypothetical protein|nr:Ig domain protein group 2 domain protein [Herbinix sp.]
MLKNWMRKISIVLVLSLAFSLVIPSSLPLIQTDKTAEAATIKLNKKTATMKEGETLSLKVLGTKQSVTWKSSDEDIATVSRTGTVEAISAGKVTITATVNKKKYSCTITVEASVVPDFTASLYLDSNETNYVAIKVTNYGEETLTFDFDGYVLNEGYSDLCSFVNLYNTEDEIDYELVESIDVESGEEAYICYRNEDFDYFWIDSETIFYFDFSYGGEEFTGYTDTSGNAYYVEGHMDIE